MVTAERISFGGFTIAFKLTEMIDDFAAGELVIILAAPARALALALDSIVTPAWMSTSISLAGAPRRCAWVLGPKATMTSSPVRFRFIFLLFCLLFLFLIMFFLRLYRFHFRYVAFASSFFSSACSYFPETLLSDVVSADNGDSRINRLYSVDRIDLD
jgi:hypothetical protein